MVISTDTEQVREIAIRYAQKLKKDFVVKAMYLYGSYAKGTNNNDSDIDIAVVSDSFSGDIIDDRMLLMKRRRDIDVRIEPHPFTSVSFSPTDPLVDEIMKSGIRII